MLLQLNYLNLTLHINKICDKHKPAKAQLYMYNYTDKN